MSRLPLFLLLLTVIVWISVAPAEESRSIEARRLARKQSRHGDLLIVDEARQFSPPDPLADDCTKLICRPNSTSVRFFIVGDTGGLPIWPWVSRAQKKVAKQMMKVAQQHGVDFVVNVGDNFYFTGVSNDRDHRFSTSFEDVYGGDLRTVPWYFVAGNHDHFGNISAQVAYSARSRRWRMPSLFYRSIYELSDGTRLEFVFIDTIELCGNTADVENGGFLDMITSGSHDPQGPENATQAEIHWQWIEQQLKKSKADYLFVVGHYPVLSVSSHGPTRCLRSRLDALLAKYGVSAYLAGHDHTLQHLAVRVDSDDHDDIHHTVTYVVSGAGSRTDTSMKHLHDVPPRALQFHWPQTGWFNPLRQLGFGGGGFIDVFVDSTVRTTMRFLDADGVELHSLILGPRKNIAKKNRV